MNERELVETLGGLELNDRVRVQTSDDSTFEGPASVIDYVPEDSLRVEVRPGDPPDRYELSASYDDGWSELAVRYVDAGDENAEWEDLGTVERVNALEEDG